uniref:uncharacterized protein LOC120326485 n=1 Tax=Styela clava TaxID=7725 RepID=UPI00193ADBFE|nr:uncharacterized protein LOC120326485 [Styela clava]
MDRIFYGVSKMTTQTIAENKSNLKLKYRAHNNYVLQAAPKDKLLVFKCSDGWLPLCNFLNLPVPNVPFPHGNKGGGSYIDRESHPQAVKMRHEVYHSIAAIFSISLGMFLYLLW